jgi:TetR/AcrR family transcriptional regulator, transcriptional repressor for nem operon
VVRKSKAEAAETRQRIVRAAADEFREKGIAEAGLAELMAAAGLTHGGFYRHFESKNQLVAEAFDCAAVALKERLESFIAEAIAEAEPGRGLEAAVLGYLAAAHRDELATGCPFSALAGELVRQDETIRDHATADLKGFIEVIRAQLDQPSSEAARREAIGIVSTLVGALTLARLSTDPALSDAILGRAAADILQDRRV